MLVKLSFIFFFKFHLILPPIFSCRLLLIFSLVSIFKSDVKLAGWEKVIEGTVVKACLLTNFYFSQNDSPSETMKNVFYFIGKALFVLKIFRFFYFRLPFFFPLSAIALEVVRR